ncbi:Band 7 protein (fragment) [groundwater metagenome]|uniref:Band 7 protein n=1 Tax=groundwater metagenome TaxID=717931 RepID=A0A098E904_9ZZZZ
MAQTINMDDFSNPMKKARDGFSGSMKIVVITAVLFFALIFTFGFLVVTIPAGHVGVQYSWSGGVQDEVFKEGWHLKAPWISVTVYSARTIEKTDTMHALSNEGLSINIDATILYHIVPNKANEIHKNIGPDYEDVVVITQFRSVVREVVADYQAIDIYSEKRAVLENHVFEEISKRLKEKNIIVESVLFRNVELPEQLKTSIEEKKKAEQDSLRMEYILEKEKKEADRKRIEAQGISDANKIIANSLTSQYLTWYWITNLDKYNSVIYVPIGESGMPVFKDVDNVRTDVVLNVTKVINSTG